MNLTSVGQTYGGRAVQRPGTIRAGWQSQVPELRYLLSVMAGVVQNELGMEGQIFSNKLPTWFLARFYSTSPVPPASTLSTR